MSGAKKVEKDRYLFREGDAPDAMYVVKSGKFAVVKSKTNSEIVLAEIGPGAMVGEMAFFDNKPRSASVKALRDSEVVSLPYKALHAQFANFPEWCKAIMRTVNDHLRNANQRLKQLENTSDENSDFFTPHAITKLLTILNFVGMKYGKTETEGLQVPDIVLRNYTIQVFQEATNKMAKLLSTLSDLKQARIEDVGAGRQRIIVFKPDVLFGLVEWYNEWLFKKEEDRVAFREEELPTVAALVHFGKKVPKNEKGITKVNLGTVQAESATELGYSIKMDDVNSLIEKGFLTEKMAQEAGVFTDLSVDDLEKQLQYWTIIYALKKVTR